MHTLHLICNAHLDPVWLWEWEEGAAEAISTFRVAANFCEEFDGFVFNHNEVILYRWVEEYDPLLFARIQALVAQGKWNIMGGWYLQPDCNMPSGESFVRQILIGRAYFNEKFGVEPTTAINFDPFGHTRGLVQIMAKSGYDSYVFGRPGKEGCALPGDDFTWVGYDGSEIIGHRAWGNYQSQRGMAAKKARDWMSNHPDKPEGLLLWGIGNHGGGPSRIDLQDLTTLITELPTARSCIRSPKPTSVDCGRRIHPFRATSVISTPSLSAATPRRYASSKSIGYSRMNSTCWKRCCRTHRCREYCLIHARKCARCYMTCCSPNSMTFCPARPFSRSRKPRCA